MKLIFSIVCLISSFIVFAENTNNTASDQDNNNYHDKAWQNLTFFASEFGTRFGGSKTEKKAGDWLNQQLSAMGYQVTKQNFSFSHMNVPRTSSNYEVNIKGKTSETIVIAAHYDAVASVSGSTGFADNASGVATLLQLADNLKQQSLYYSVKLIFFGAEEMGLQGSKYYAKSLSTKPNFIAMINLDTVFGGDQLYIHSAHSKPYSCEYLEQSNYSYNTSARDALFAEASKSALNKLYLKHPDTQDYPAGETGSWSDHAPFACLGVPIAYIEATNFNISGKNGNDGYSQSVNPDLWTCFDKDTLTACDRKKEKGWGQIWHTEFDQQSALMPALESQIRQQFFANIELLTEFIKSADVNTL